MTAINNEDRIGEDAAYLLERNDLLNRLGNAITTYLNIPGLVGFWPFSSTDVPTGNAYSLSGQARGLTLIGNPKYNIYNDLIPCIDLDGVGDYLTRGDEPGLRITGTETFNANPGLTFGMWSYPTSFTGSAMTLSKYTNPSNRSFLAHFLTNGELRFAVSQNGTSDVGFNSTIASTLNAWNFLAFRYTPSSEMKTFINGKSEPFSTAIPANIFSGTAPLQIGAHDGGTALFTGRKSFVFLSANSLSDAYIDGLREQTKVLFS